MQTIRTLKSGVLGRCPRCGKGSLFAGFFTIADTCNICNFNLGKLDTEDGPVFFVVLIVGAVIVAASLIVEALVEPPYWLHLLIWVPLILCLSIGLLRPIKGIFFAISYSSQTDEIS